MSFHRHPLMIRTSTATHWRLGCITRITPLSPAPHAVLLLMLIFGVQPVAGQSPDAWHAPASASWFDDPNAPPDEARPEGPATRPGRGFGRPGGARGEAPPRGPAGRRFQPAPFELEEFLPTQPTAADRGPLTPAEREELQQFARERLPRFFAWMSRERRPDAGTPFEMWTRLRVLRRVSKADPATGELLAGMIRQEHLIRSYGRVITLLPEESRAAPLLKGELRAAVARLLQLEHDLLAARLRYARQHADRILDERATALLAGDRPLPPLDSIRQIIAEARAEQDATARDALKARLVSELKGWTERFLSRAEAEVARRNPASPTEVEARTRQLLARIERAHSSREGPRPPHPEPHAPPTPEDAPSPDEAPPHEDAPSPEDTRAPRELSPW